MSDFALIFANKVEDEIRTKIVADIDRWKWVVPSWCHEMYVSVYTHTEGDSDGASTMASINVQYAYRYVSLSIMCAWLNQSDEARSLQILHELLHIPLSVLADYAVEEIERAVPESEAPKYNGALIAELARRTESATQDLAVSIYNQFSKQ